MPTEDTKPPERDIFCRSLALRAESVNDEHRSFEAVVSTETPALVYDYAGDRVIEEVLVARGGKFPESVPLLDDHQRYGGVNSVMGSASGFSLEGDRWTGRGVVGRAAEGNPHREQVWMDVADGHIKAVSIGYRVLEYIDIPPGQRKAVNGKTYEAAQRTLRITTKWRAHELSLTPIGADREARIRSEAEQPPETTKRGYFAK